MRAVVAPVWLLPFTACAPEIDLEARGLAPTATIVAPTGGAVVPDGALGAVGRVSDPQDPPGRLLAVWSVRDVDGAWRDVCTGFAEEDGTTRCLMPLSPGDDTVRLRATDLPGFRGDALVSVTVVDEDAPQVVLERPEPGDGPWYADIPVPVQAAIDDDDPPDDWTIRWTSDQVGELDGPEEAAVGGSVSGVLALPEGTHAVTLSVTDGFGLTGRDTVTWVVGPDNEPPRCRVDTPRPGDVKAEGAGWTVEAYAVDPERAVEGMTVSVASDVDGRIGERVPDETGTVVWEDLALSFGDHVLTVVAEDHVGARCTREVPVEVAVAPTLEVSSPTDDLGLPSGRWLPIDLRVQHPTRDASVWTVQVLSDLTGPWTMPEPDATGRVQTEVPIAPGVHRITFRAVAPDGLASAPVVRDVSAGLP